MKSKFLLINKPVDWTSHDVVAYVRSYTRKKTGIKKTHPIKSSGNPEVGKAKFNRVKVGHAGTLDPFATGLLIVGVGRESTKRLDEFKNLPKTYEAVLKLGETSDTCDSTGEILKQVQNDNDTNVILSLLRDPLKTKKISPLRSASVEMTKPTKKQIKQTLKSFTGKQLQTPPMFSAKKVKGKKLYDLARQGITIERKPCEIIIYKIKLKKYKYPYLKIKVECSTGTYIRTLADDIGKKLEVGAYCDELKRTRIGKYKLWRAKKVPFKKFK